MLLEPLPEQAPLRKQLKDAARASRGKHDDEVSERDRVRHERLAQWELTVGIEIHAQLNTSSKLFSRASAEYTDVPNAASWPFDLAVPGSQPLFQPAVLVPAIRAALALKCQIQRRSKFDRKHYFYHDQPAGYQITQYYEPLARDGHLVLTQQDGLGEKDGGKIEIGIKQVQLEQDTAKTQEQDEVTSLIDFNRSGHALIEIISLPHLHTPEAAAAYVRKVQSILYAVDAATTGMELGGLRADVNVSVRRLDDNTSNHSYSGVGGLGQRTEIKNLSSFKSVEDAVRAERDRQIDVLESGGTIEGETRGWSLSAPGVTRRLRGKEGEVDYRYMPDPDISPLYIHPEVVEHLREHLPPVPEQLLDMLCANYGFTVVDAQALLALDNGGRLLWYQDIVAHLKVRENDVRSRLGVQVGNWVLHELGALLTTTETQWHPGLIDSQQMADLVSLQAQNKLTGPSAKRLLRILFDGDKRSVAEIAEEENLLFMPMTDEEYDALADAVIEANSSEADVVRQNGKQAKGKLKFLLGQMMRQGDRNRIEAQRAERILQTKLSPVGA
ncbi:hypothetical protein LTR24_005405 [Lithohypha guttulata]|uniref:Glutamyl-tRNA(Gln) amidotransferase subunit B, mitochondrial n=1 Tax=Lithohypha guttulata TaxID=1690604 RepID=A0ABR0K993_9EURO|nr:hypothetical protein LTR24_005405 [Lithohypha guttulata]